MGEGRTRLKLILIVFMIGGFTFLQYSTEMAEHTHHLLYQGLFFFPVMLAGFWFGLRRALTASLSITLILLPLSIMHWKGFGAEDFNNFMEMILYNGVALTLGKLRDREQAKQRRLYETESLAVMGNAVSGLAHDIKTPLVAIGGFIRSLQKKLGKDDPLHEKLAIIMDESQRLENMVKEMLDFARPLELRRSKEDINLVVSQSIAIITEEAERRKVKILSHAPPNLPLVSLDATRMRQALINLLMNAIEASPEGEKVVVSIYQKRRRLIIDVSDRGCGIPSDKKEAVFALFLTTKAEGTGLGLPIAKKIMEAHQGLIEVLDNSEKGVTIRVKIPILE